MKSKYENTPETQQKYHHHLLLPDTTLDPGGWGSTTEVSSKTHYYFTCPPNMQLKDNGTPYEDEDGNEANAVGNKCEWDKQWNTPVESMQCVCKYCPPIGCFWGVLPDHFGPNFPATPLPGGGCGTAQN